jgi:L-ascorbate metabolism protein UlaG (beta-lactamase superfamily)
VYVKPNVVLEPLYQQWYAWPHLISPATAAMNVLNRHLRIMDSYVKSPSMHERFARDPKMLGSPFMATAASRVEDVRLLRDRTRRDHGQMVDFANAVAELSALLQDAAAGYSLDELYAQVPEPLQGYVELFYDLDNHPSFRFLEPLLYRSPYYDESAQSVALYLIEKDGRPFVLSTPRLTADGTVHLKIPFAHPGLDALFRMRTCPGSYCHTRDLLEITPEQEPLFRSFFTEEPPAPPVDLEPTAVHIKYFGHACVLVMYDGMALLTDPAISYTYESEVRRYTYTDLPDHIDCVLITHNHQDHVLFETLIQLRHKIGQVIVPRNSGGSLQDPSMKLMFEALGFQNVRQLEDLESVALRGCTVTGIPFLGEHADLNIRSKLGYHVALKNGLKILFVADSCCAEPKIYHNVHAIVGDVDMLLLGMECDGAPLSWLYGPLLLRHLPREMDQSRRLSGSDCRRGMDLVNQFNPSEVYVYAMGQEPWLRHIMALEYTPDSRPIVASNELVETCRKRGIVAKRLFGREVIRGECLREN